MQKTYQHTNTQAENSKPEVTLIPCGSYYNVPYCTVWPLHLKKRFSTVLYCTVLYCTILIYSAPHGVPRHFVLSPVILCLSPGNLCRSPGNILCLHPGHAHLHFVIIIIFVALHLICVSSLSLTSSSEYLFTAKLEGQNRLEILFPT